MPVSDPATVEGVTERRVPRRRLRFAIALLVAVAGLVALAGPASAATKIAFVQGEQNVTVTRPGDGLNAAVSALLAGPTPAERRTQIRSYILPGTPVLSVSQTGTVATIDLGARFVAGTDSDTLLARLSQVVTTVTAVPGVTSVQVLIQGGVPLGLFPGINATTPLTTAALRTPNVAPPPPTPERPTTPTQGTKGAQQRLADLGYLLPNERRRAARPGDDRGGDRVPEVGGPAARRRPRPGDARAPAHGHPAHAAHPAAAPAGGSRC